MQNLAHLATPPGGIAFARSSVLYAGQASSSASPVYATPCPFGFYQVISMKLFADNQGLCGVTLTYAPVASPGPPPALTMADDGWLCQHTHGYMLRNDPDGSGQPQCVSVDGVQCLDMGSGCYNALRCALGTWAPLTCSAVDGYRQSKHPCSVGRAVVGMYGNLQTLEWVCENSSRTFHSCGHGRSFQVHGQCD
jgi:hypothetical protein